MYSGSSLSQRQREAAVALFEGGYGSKAVAARLGGVSRSAVGRLHSRWKLRGAGALLVKPAKQSFSFEFKLGVVRRVIDGVATPAALAREHELSSPKLVENWVRRYRREGEDALRPKRQGRPPRNPLDRSSGGSVGGAEAPQSESELSEVQRLRRENQRLAAENAYLKKLRALRAQGRG